MKRTIKPDKVYTVTKEGKFNEGEDSYSLYCKKGKLLSFRQNGVELVDHHVILPLGNNKWLVHDGGGTMLTMSYLKQTNYKPYSYELVFTAKRKKHAE